MLPTWSIAHRGLFNAHGKPSQAFGVTVYQNRDISALLLPSGGDEPGDIPGFGNFLLLDLDDDVPDA